MSIEYITFKSFSIFGAARSGIAAARLLKDKGYKVLLTESRKSVEMAPEIVAKLRSLDIETEFGGHTNRVYENDAFVISPGIPQDSQVIIDAVSKHKEIVSEIEVAYWFCKGRIIGVTGTNGKTTTTTLIGKLLNDGGRKAFVCGNIGTAFSDVISGMSESDYAVVEVSSFQLDNIRKFKPNVAVLLNITPDHLDRYNHSFEKYISSKMRLIENQTKQDSLIYNYDDPIIRENLFPGPVLLPFSIIHNLADEYETCAFMREGQLVWSGEGKINEIINADDLIVKGEHNIYNVLASILAARASGVSIDSIRNTLLKFEGVEHRMEFIKELMGIKFYNDSKATNVNSVMYAVRAFSQPILLMLGGRDKGNDYTGLQNEVRKSVRKIIAFGESREKIYQFFKNIVPVVVAKNLSEAVQKAYVNAQEGNIVLLSPACASFDEFENYEHRGQEFKKLVNDL